MKLFPYENKLVRVTDVDGRTFTGIAETFPAEYGLHEFGVEEESVSLGEEQLFAGDIAKIEVLPTYGEGVENRFPVPAGSGASVCPGRRGGPGRSGNPRPG